MKKNYESLVAQMSHLENEIQRLKQTVIEEVWLDSADLKQLFNFSESKLYRLRKSALIPFTAIGGRYYYPKSYFTQALMKKVKENERND